MITPQERRRYPLVERDGEILEAVHELENIHDLSEDELFLLLFLRTQLEKDWRKPCLDLLREWKTMKTHPSAERWKRLRKLQKDWWKPQDM